MHFRISCFYIKNLISLRLVYEAEEVLLIPTPDFPRFLLCVRCKSGVIFVRRCFRDGLELVYVAEEVLLIPTPDFPRFYYYVRCKSGVIFVRRCFHDGLELVYVAEQDCLCLT